MEPEHGNQSRARRPGESEDQMSIAEFGLRPQDSFTSFLPKMDITTETAGFFHEFPTQDGHNSAVGRIREAS